MKKFRVGIEYEVEAETREEAVEKARAIVDEQRRIAGYTDQEKAAHPGQKNTEDESKSGADEAEDSGDGQIKPVEQSTQSVRPGPGSMADIRPREPQQEQLPKVSVPASMKTKTGGPEKKRKGLKKKLLLRILLILFLLIIIVVIGLSIWCVRIYRVGGDSMSPNFKDGKYLITIKRDTLPIKIGRGTVVIHTLSEGDNKVYIKRIVGLPNERIKISNGDVYIGGKGGDVNNPISESYLTSGTKTDGSADMIDGDGQYFLLGDNRENSSDSRNWGLINDSNIKSTVLFSI